MAGIVRDDEVAGKVQGLDSGWQLGEFSSRSVHFFCTKIVELQTVEISPTDPGIEYYAPLSPLEWTLNECASLVLRANA
jgi:hypothetical protein